MSNDPNGFSPSPFSTSPFEENTLLSFNWLISDLNLLRDEVELSPMPSEGGRSVSAGAGKSEIWTRQPVFGGGSWKVELVRTHRADEGVEEQAKDSINEENESQVEEHQSENTDGETSENDQVKDEKDCERNYSSISLFNIFTFFHQLTSLYYQCSKHFFNSYYDWVES